MAVLLHDANLRASCWPSTFYPPQRIHLGVFQLSRSLPTKASKFERPGASILECRWSVGWWWLRSRDISHEPVWNPPPRGRRDHGRGVYQVNFQNWGGLLNSKKSSFPSIL